MPTWELDIAGPDRWTLDDPKASRVFYLFFKLALEHSLSSACGLKSPDLSDKKDNEGSDYRQTPTVNDVPTFGGMFRGFIYVHGRLRFLLK